MFSTLLGETRRIAALLMMLALGALSMPLITACADNDPADDTADAIEDAGDRIEDATDEVD